MYKCLRILFVIFVLLTLWSTNSFSETEVPSEVLLAAQDFLNFSVEKSHQHSDWFETKWEVSVDNPDNLRLGIPYEVYVIENSETVLIANGREMFSGENLRGYGIPVFNGARFVGTIRVGIRNGNWEFNGLNFSTNSIDMRLLKFREDFIKDSDRRIVKVSSRQLGIYLVIMNRADIQYVTPVVDWTASMMSIQKSINGDYPLVEYIKFKNRLSSKARMLSEAPTNDG